jgi:hypothetical protein
MEAEMPQEQKSPHVHVPVAPDVFGSELYETADQGVSAPQKEAEADELNG